MSAARHALRLDQLHWPAVCIACVATIHMFMSWRQCWHLLVRASKQHRVQGFRHQRAGRQRGMERHWTSTREKCARRCL